MVSAANRGVILHGAIPKSDIAGSSSTVYTYLTNASSYASTNVVHFVTPFSKADGSAFDTGQLNLIHEKYMVIDPWSDYPTVILGSANWSRSALSDTNQNDENVVFMRHAAIARMYYAQFKRMTGLWQDRDDFWCDIGMSDGSIQAGLWTTDTNRFAIERADDVMNMSTWTSVVSDVSGSIGRVFVTTNGMDVKGFFRASRK
jgi:phosphatidylserine/phosphatidylglycerophosphate/cardiolipin synthase-like enzyme